MWGGVCPGPPGTGCFYLTWGVWGVNAVTVHQGHARSASHWQARSTDLKLSHPPRSRQMWRAVCQLVRCGLGTRGPQASLLDVGQTSGLGHAAEIGDCSRTNRTGRTDGQQGGKRALPVGTRRCAGVGLDAGSGLGAVPNAPPSAPKEPVLGQSAYRLSLSL
jgi:hypothetical protein